MSKSVIVVAGGKGLRMGSELPKQFIPIGGKPVLMHTIEAFYKYDNLMQIILVLPVSHQKYWDTLCDEYKFEIPHTIADGGETRFHSVKNGLKYVKNDFVAVQDGVRPFGSVDLIRSCFAAAAVHAAVIPVIDSTDSLREMIDDERSHIIDRSKIRLVQTPQVFLSELLQRAYKSEFNNMFTDDASVVESLGVTVHLVKGEVTNILSRMNNFIYI